jgi:hypothetical protein
MLATLSEFLIEFAPYGVSFVALAGVIVTNRMSAKNLLAIERERSAETMKAENIRHENEMRRASRIQLLDRVRDLYIDVERARRELSAASKPLSGSFEGLDSWRERTATDRQNFREAAVKYQHVHDVVMLLGSAEVREQSYEVLGSAISAEVATDAFLEESVDRPYTEFTVVKSLYEALRADCAVLLDEMRNELHPSEIDRHGAAPLS